MIDTVCKNYEDSDSAYLVVGDPKPRYPTVRRARPGREAVSAVQIYEVPGKGSGTKPPMVQGQGKKGGRVELVRCPAEIKRKRERVEIGASEFNCTISKPGIFFAEEETRGLLGPPSALLLTRYPLQEFPLS